MKVLSVMLENVIGGQYGNIKVYGSKKNMGKGKMK